MGDRAHDALGVEHEGVEPGTPRGYGSRETARPRPDDHNIDHAVDSCSRSYSRLLEANDLVTPRPNADVYDRRRDQLADTVEVSTRLDRQRLERARFARRLLPPLEPLVHRLDVLQR